MKLRFLNRYFRAARTISKDEDGIVLVWATILMVAIIALAGLALDASRVRSLKTQMQAGADALALAGARELDGSNGSITRATNAINNMISNTPEGMGADATKITAATITFYSSLYADTDPNIGVVTTNPNAAKYVGVTVTAQSVAPIFVNLSLSTDALAVAGYDFALCNMPPVFICNPYEQAGDTNETATNRWTTQVALSTNQQQLMRMTVNGGTNYGPGHFGFLMPPSTDVTCNGSSGSGASSIACWIGKVNPPACYRKRAVDLNTGQMQSVFDAFNVRFDMYGGNIKATPDYAPAINVRKGYLPGSGSKGACNPTKQDVISPNPAYGVIVPQVTIQGTFENVNNPKKITFSSTPAGTLYVGSLVTDAASVIPSGAYIAAMDSTSITLSASAPNSQKGMAITAFAGGPDQYNAKANAVPLPLDLNMIGPGNTVSPGNGQWDCQDYWKIVHGTTPPTGCGDGASNPTTLSRFQIYKMESSLLNDAAGPGAPAGGGEIGAPTCNPPGTATDGGGGDRRMIYAAIINCLANSALITGGQTANDIPVAGFGKFFMTQPADVGNQTLYGEMTGAVGLDKNAKNNVQLYR